MVSLMNKNRFIVLAKDVINLEIKALQKLRKNINRSFSDAVVKIANCQSKVILCGVGKSGLIASKIAATLASVGTPSFSLAASEASHGDLGMISKNDILILLSYSGKTSELKNIIKYANRNKIFLIGIVSKKESILYRARRVRVFMPSVNSSLLRFPGRFFAFTLLWLKSKANSKSVFSNPFTLNLYP